MLEVPSLFSKLGNAMVFVSNIFVVSYGASGPHFLVGCFFCCWCFLGMKHITPQSLTVRPWKVTFPIGKQSSNHHFSGAMLNFGGVPRLCGDYFMSHEIRIWSIKQPVFHGKYLVGFFGSNVFYFLKVDIFPWKNIWGILVKLGTCNVTSWGYPPPTNTEIIIICSFWRLAIVEDWS